MFAHSRWVWPFFFLFFLSFYPLRAQVTFCLPVLNNVTPGSVVNMPLQVAEFDSIVGVQFVLQWDPAVLNYLTVFNFNLPGLVIQHFGTNETGSGILRFAWNTPLVRTGVSLPDSTAIFWIKFSAKGQTGQGTAVTFTEIPPTQFEVLKADTSIPPLRIEDCVLKHGYVAIGFSVSAEETIRGVSPLSSRVYPNPFIDRTTLVLELSSADEVRVVLKDVVGRLVSEQQYFLPSGHHGIEIASSQLPRNGLYFLLIRTKTQASLLPLMKL